MEMKEFNWQNFVPLYKKWLMLGQNITKTNPSIVLN